MKVLADTESLSAVADAIRAKSGGNEELSFPDGFVDVIEGIEGGYDKGYAEGHEKGYAEGETKGEEQGYSRGYGEGYEKGGNVTRYMRNFQAQFSDVVFPEGYEMDLAISGSFYNSTINQFIYRAKGIRKLKLSCVQKGATITADYAFAGSGSDQSPLEVVDLSDFGCIISSASVIFAYSPKLKTIIGELDFSACTRFISPFVECDGLEDVRFVVGCLKASISFDKSQLLSAESIQSIIDGLADLTGGTAQTLTLHATVKAKLTEAQIAQITSKNWTLA